MTKLILVLLVALSNTAFAVNSTSDVEPTFTVIRGKQQKVFSYRQMVEFAKDNLTVERDPTYPTEHLHYHVVSITELFRHAGDTDKIERLAKTNSVFEFSCDDGFAAQLPISLIANTDPKIGAVAYIAVEPKDEKWPKIKNRETSAGTYYLIWQSAEKSNIGAEQWPFQVRKLSIKSDLKTQFAKTVPVGGLADVQAGYQVFLKNCFTCHTFNGEGNSHMGPDLNIPLSPTEYLRDGILKKQIRNSEKLHRWPESKMSKFSEEMLSDAEIDQLTQYFLYMKGRKAL